MNMNLILGHGIARTYGYLLTHNNNFIIMFQEVQQMLYII